MHKRVRDEIEQRGLARSNIAILEALLKLRQVCCDPRLLKTGERTAASPVAKFELLMDMLPSHGRDRPAASSCSRSSSRCSS